MVSRNEKARRVVDDVKAKHSKTDLEGNHDDSSRKSDFTDSTQSSADLRSQSSRDEEREIFAKAREYLNPGKYFRFVVNLYAERKLWVFFWIHFVSTMVVWSHFALIKFQQQAEAVPEGAHRYWLKRLAPALEFGSMHAILFQMALLPITMCRFSIAELSESFVNKIVPLNRTLRMHIHLGYTMILIVFFATVFFFFFFGLLCAEGEEDFCAKFKSEIMITGYAILGMLLIVGGTSYFRHRIPYEVFYAIHHLVFILYFVTIAHTIDVEQRRGMKERSQTFKWFSATLVYYFCDRAAMHLNHQYESRLLGSSRISGSTGSKMIILKLDKPILFNFKPGQYAYLRCSAIDSSWHPFSIASCPESSQLEFYIEVFDQKTWTRQLWDRLDHDTTTGGVVSNLKINFEVMGPYGTSIAKTEDYSHVLAVGAGTGIVPLLSLYKEHIRNMLRLEPKKFFTEMRENERKIRQIEDAMKTSRKCFTCKKARPNQEDARRRKLNESIRDSISIHDMLTENVQRRNIKELKKEALQATQSIYGVVLLTILPVTGISLFALTVSWNTTPIDLYPGMIGILKVFTMVFQALFAFVAFFVWNASGLVSYVDYIMVIISPFADWYWMLVCETYSKLRPVDILTYSILILYMTFRLWFKAVMPRESNLVRPRVLRSSSNSYQLNLVWSTRSASLVSEILPDILSLWNLLIRQYGLEAANHVCRVAIHVTDPNKEACDMLRREYERSMFYQTGGIRFGRSDLSRLIEDHSLGLVTTRRNSQSLLAFCGSPALAREVHSYKISNDMVLAITGNKKHHMDFISESYGGVKATPAPLDTSIKHASEKCEEAQPLTSRQDISYFDTRGRIRRSSVQFSGGDCSSVGSGRSSVEVVLLDSDASGQFQQVRAPKRSLGAQIHQFNNSSVEFIEGQPGDSNEARIAVDDETTDLDNGIRSLYQPKPLQQRADVSDGKFIS